MTVFIENSVFVWPKKYSIHCYKGHVKFQLGQWERIVAVNHKSVSGGKIRQLTYPDWAPSEFLKKVNVLPWRGFLPSCTQNLPMNWKFVFFYTSSGRKGRMKILIKIKICPIKGSVQRELRKVKNSNNRWLLAWDLGTEHNFFIVGSVHLVLNIFLVPVRTAKFIGNFWINRRSAAKLFPCFDYSFVSLCCAITISVAIFCFKAKCIQ